MTKAKQQSGSTAKPAQSYRMLKSKLDEVLSRLQDETLDLDEAAKLHKQGQELVKELTAYIDAVAQANDDTKKS